MPAARDGAPAREQAAIAAILVAAGRSSRFGALKKEYRPLGSGVVLDASLAIFLRHPAIDLVILVLPPGGLDEARRVLDPSLMTAEGTRLRLVEGGLERADSVRSGLEALGAFGPELVLVHDGARPWASPALIDAVIARTRSAGACVPGLPPVDTIKELGPDGAIARHPPRGSLLAVQTPQGFRFGELLESHRRAAAEGFACTDDAEVWARYQGPVATVDGERGNRKITFPEDLEA